VREVGRERERQTDRQRAKERERERKRERERMEEGQMLTNCLYAVTGLSPTVWIAEPPRYAHKF
jgi:hypothetical protein